MNWNLFWRHSERQRLYAQTSGSFTGHSKAFVIDKNDLKIGKPDDHYNVHGTTIAIYTKTASQDCIMPST